MNVLVVEDNEDHLYLAKLILEEEGHSVLTADTVEDALMILECEDVDIVVLDIMMPKMDGYDAIRCIRENPRLEDLPAIALTVCAHKDDEAKILASGFDDYLSKPYIEEDLVDRVNAVLSEGRRREEDPGVETTKECG